MKQAQKQATFTLRLMPSVRQTAEAFSRKEGVSLNQFIHIAVAERVARMEHEAWLERQEQFSPELRTKALDILAKTSNNPVEPGDELPEGYQPLIAATTAKPD